MNPQQLMPEDNLMSCSSEGSFAVSGCSGRGAGATALLLIGIVGGALVPTWIVARGSDTYDERSYERDVSDGLVFRAGAELLLDGASPYTREVRLDHIAATRLDGKTPPYDLPFAYGPNALPLFALYAIGTPQTGYFIFVFLGSAALMFATVACGRRLGATSSDQILSAVVVGFSTANLFSVLLGQTGGYIGALVLGYAATFGRQPITAGVLLGLAAFKPQYALFLGIVALVDRQWRTIMWSMATLLVCTLVSGLWFGFHLWSDFVHAVTAPNHTITDMCNWFIIPGTFEPEIYNWIQACGVPVMAGGAVVLAVVLHSMRGRGVDQLQCLGVACAWAVLVSPNTHPYDLTLWTLPLCLVARNLLRTSCWSVLGVVGTTCYFLPRPVFALISIALIACCLMRRSIAPFMLPSTTSKHLGDPVVAR